MKHLFYFYHIYTKYLSGKVWLLLLLTVLVALADGLGISMLLPLLQSLEVGGANNSSNILTRITDFFGITGSLTGILMFMFLIFLGKALLKFGAGYFQSNLYKELYRYLKIHFYDAILNVDYQYFTTKNAGYFITVMDGHTNKLIRSFNVFVILISAIVMTISYLGMAALISWQVSAMAIGLGAVMLGLLTVVNRYVRRLSQQISVEETRMSQIAIQALHSFKYIISTASYKPIQRQYISSIHRLTGLQFRTELANAFTNSIQELIAVGMLIAMIIIEVVILGYPIGSVFVVLLLFYRGVNQMMGIQQNWQVLISSQGFLESVDNELENLKNNAVKDGIQHCQIEINKSKIHFIGLTFQYIGSDSSILHDLTLTIEPNTTVALVGPSGAGKTTLVDLLTGLLRPTKGSVQIDGKPLSEFQLETWRSRIGYVSQDLIIFDDSLANNISLFDPVVDFDRIEYASKMASVDEFIQGLPQGYNTQIGENGVRLSGGQKQRLFIARELYKQPDLLILDEATSALDSESERFIQESIDALQGKVTVIIIAHRLSTIRHADVIYVLERGHLIEFGSYEDLVKNSETAFSKMIFLQS